MGRSSPPARPLTSTRSWSPSPAGDTTRPARASDRFVAPSDRDPDDLRSTRCRARPNRPTHAPDAARRSARGRPVRGVQPARAARRGVRPGPRIGVHRGRGGDRPAGRRSRGCRSPGVGPFPAKVDAVTPAGDGLAVTLTVTNEGDSAGQTTCRINRRRGWRHRGRGRFVTSPRLGSARAAHLRRAGRRPRSSSTPSSNWRSRAATP